MATPSSRKDYFNTEEGQQILAELKLMARNESYNTTSTYSPNTVLYSDNLIPFVDKHMNYIINHPSIEPTKYLANIKLMTRTRV